MIFNILHAQSSKVLACLITILMVLNKCSSPTIPTQLSTETHTPKQTIESKPTNTQSSATPSPSPIATKVLKTPPQSVGWVWYQDQLTGYQISYPQTWSYQKDWESSESSVITGRSTENIQERTRFFGPDTGPEVIIDMWDIASVSNFDLLSWIRANPEGVLLSNQTQSIFYNATILGIESVFHSRPPSGQSGQMAMILFKASNYIFRILFNSSAIPPREPEARIYIAMLKSFYLPTQSEDSFSLPARWEQEIDLTADQSSGLNPTNTPPSTLRLDRLTLTGTVEEWTKEFLNEGTFLMRAENGDKYSVIVKPINVVFNGIPIDEQFNTQLNPPAVGDNLLVRGYSLTPGELIAEFISVEHAGKWTIWLRRTLFEAADINLHGVLSRSYSDYSDISVWVEGTLQDVLSHLVDKKGNQFKIDGKLNEKKNSLASGHIIRSSGFRVVLDSLYVQNGDCLIIEGTLHCKNWQLVYPANNILTISGTVLSADIKAKTLVLDEPIEGFIAVIWSSRTLILDSKGTTIEPDALTSGVTFTAKGELGEAGALLADEITVTSPG
ncbi:MAG: hypothetical protein PHQ40_21525 [Anaerolineaceae bacterium]|nr:hypothetical protein [Anaerolineaceae bacterium]